MSTHCFINAVFVANLLYNLVAPFALQVYLLNEDTVSFRKLNWDSVHFILDLTS